MAAPRVLEPGDLFLGGDYRLEHKLGEGGMGQVWKATELFSGNVVAIKILRRATESFVTRFRTECRYYTKLRHDNIVRMARAGVAEDGTLYIVMELLEGRTLRDIVSSTRRRRLPLLHALHVMIQLADAMQYVHRKGIYHRDLKPENLMVSTAEETKGHLWIVDFGIATFANPHEPGALDSKELPEVGTLFYLSPEQARPGRIKPDGRADIYSFGVILYELLAGRHPFVRGDEPTTPEAILNGHLCAEIEPLHEIIEDLPPEVWDVTARCLARSVSDRYPTFEDVGEALRSLMRSSLPPEHYIAKRIVRDKQAKARRATFDHALGEESEVGSKAKPAPKAKPALTPIPRTGLHLDVHRVKTKQGDPSSPALQAAIEATRQTEELPAGYVPSTTVTPFQPVVMPLREVHHDAPSANDLEQPPAQSEVVLDLDRASIQGEVIALDRPPIQGEVIALVEPDEGASRAPVSPEPDPLDPLTEPVMSPSMNAAAPYVWKPVVVTDLIPVSPELQRVREELRAKARATTAMATATTEEKTPETPKMHTPSYAPSYSPSYAPSIEAMKALAFGAPPARESAGSMSPSLPSLPPRAETPVTPPTPLSATIAPNALRARDRSKRALMVAPFVGLGMAALLVMVLIGARWARERVRASEPSPLVEVSAAPPAIAAPSAAATEAPSATAHPVASASVAPPPAPTAEMRPTATTTSTAPAHKPSASPPKAKVQKPTLAPSPFEAHSPPPASPAPSAKPKSNRIFGNDRDAE